MYSLLLVFCQLLSGMLDKKMMLRQEVKHSLKYVRGLKRIDDELWCCHDAGITVYSFELNNLRKLRIHPDNQSVYSVSSLDINTVVIATGNGLSTSSKQGM